MTQVFKDEDKTDWFHASVDPVHLGWYECRFDCDTAPRFLKYVGNGRWFALSSFAENDSDSDALFDSVFGLKGGCNWIATDECWRGLKEKPL